VSTVGEGYLAVGQTIFNFTGATGSQTITAYIGGTGNTGTYTISGSPVLVASTNMQSKGDFYNPPYAYGGDITVTAPTVAGGVCTWTTAGTNNYVAGNAVIITSTSSMPAPFLRWTPYYVTSTNLSSSTFCLSATQGGSDIVPTADGSGTITVAQDSADLYILLLAYKNNALFKQLVIDQINQFQAGVAAGGGGSNNIPGWFQDMSARSPGNGYGSPWAPCPSDEYQPCFQSYEALKSLN